MKNAIDALPLPPVYYRPDPTPTYYREDSNHNWIKLDVASAKLLITQAGYETAKVDGISEVERCLLRVQEEQNVAYAAPLAGYQAGFYDINHRHVLVTESPRFITPKAGEWPTLKAVLDGMFAGDPHRQQEYLLAWWKLGVEVCRHQLQYASQIMVLAGPRSSGKSLLQALMTETFGGRSAQPYQFMSGQTPFNSDLMRAEHLLLEDESEDITMSKRRHLAGHIKKICASETQQCHGKNKEAVTLTPIWRLSCSVNDDPERLQVLPPLDSDVADKMIILKVRSSPMPMTTATPQERKLFWLQLTSELPAFLADLESWQIPDELIADRYGVRHFHHPDIVEVLLDSTPQIKLLELIDESWFRFAHEFGEGDMANPWEASAVEIERYLREHAQVKDQVGRLLNYPGKCAAYLGRLREEPAAEDRVSYRKVNGYGRWTIQPPRRGCEPAAQVSMGDPPPAS